LVFFIYIPEPKGFGLLRNAQESIKAQDYSKANFLLRDARDSDFGFCGNTYSEMLPRVDSLKVQCLFKLEEYQEVRHYISSPSYFGGYHDYFLTKSLQLEFGKETIASAFKQGMDFIRFEPEKIAPKFTGMEDSKVVYGFVPLVDLNITLKLKVTDTGVTMDWKGDYFKEMKNRVEQFMKLNEEEKLMKFYKTCQFKVLSGEQPLLDFPFE